MSKDLTESDFVRALQELADNPALTCKPNVIYVKRSAIRRCPHSPYRFRGYALDSKNYLKL